MPKNPYPQDCEKICEKIERWERAKKNFKILNTDFAYNSSTNKYTGTFLDIEVAGEIFFVTSSNIIISNNTNTLILNIAYNGTNLTTGITTEQKTVSQVSTLIAGNTYNSSASTCAFTIPIQLDGKETSGGESLCQQLSEDLATIPFFITKPTTFSYSNGTWNVNGKIVVQKGQNTFEKVINNFTGTGNNLFLKIYAQTNNFELEARELSRPIDVESFVTNNTSNCIYYIPIGFGDGTVALQHYVHDYDLFLQQFKEFIISRHYNQFLSFNGAIERVGGNTQGVGVRAGVRVENFFKPNHDNRAIITNKNGVPSSRNQFNGPETQVTLSNTNFMHTTFTGSFSTANDSFKMKYDSIGLSDANEEYENINGAMYTANSTVAKSFFIKNVVAVPVVVRLNTSTRGLIWLVTS